MAAPSTPANLSVDDVASNCIHLSWDNVANEDGFYIYRSRDNVDYDKRAKVDSDVLEFWDYDVKSETTYYYKISAYNVDGESAKSSEVHDDTLAQSWKNMRVDGRGPFPYDENAFDVKEEDAVSTRGARAETTMRAGEDPTESSEIMRKGQIQHDLDDTDYHSSDVSEGNLFEADANHLPVDSGIASSDVEGATSDSHTHGNKAQLDLLTDGDHDVRTDNPHSVDKDDVGLGDVPNVDATDCDNQSSGSTNFVLVRQTAEADLNQTISDPPTQGEVQSISDKIDALLSKLRSANVLAT